MKPITNTKPKYWVIIPASGIGQRFGQKNHPKQYTKLDNDLTILDTTLSKIIDLPIIASCVVAIAQHDNYFDNSCFKNHPKLQTVIGGKARYHSTYNALKILQSVAKPDDWVLVHDAVRPCITQADIISLIGSLSEYDIGGILATPVRDTLKMCNKQHITKTIERTQLYQAQTPQMFRFKILLDALKVVIKNKQTITDDAQAVENQGHLIKIIPGNDSNLKITYPDDLKLANLILKIEHTND